jgi:hypothetical protein
MMAKSIQEKDFLAIWAHRTSLEIAGAEFLRLSTVFEDDLNLN